MDKFKYNSEWLHRNFPEVYRDFFSTSATVASAPGNFMWGGNCAALFGAVSLRQKLPLRTYIGLKANNHGRVEIGESLRYSLREKKFIESLIPREIQDELLLFLNAEVAKLFGDPKFKGVTFNVICEMQPGFGASASSSFAAALATALYIHYGKLTYGELKRWEDMTTAELMFDKTSFIKIFRLAWKIDTIFHGVASGGGPFCSLIKSHSPVAYFIGQDEQFEAAKKYFQGKEKMDLTVLDKIYYSGFRLEEIDGNRSFRMPFDFGILHTSPGRFGFLAYNKISQELNDLADFYTNTFYRYYDKYHLVARPLFHEMYVKKNCDKMWNSYMSLLSMTTLKINEALFGLNRDRASISYLRELFKSLNDFHSLLGVLGVTTPLIDYLCVFLHRRVQKRNDEFGIGLQQLSNDKGGGVLFSLASESLKNDFCDIIENFKTTTGEDVEVGWISWRDGLEENGVVLEQSLSNNVYSEFITRGAVKVLHLDKFGLHEDLYTTDDLHEKMKTMDVLLDSVDEDIYIRGEKLTSKDIRTATITIPVVKMMMENVGKEIQKSLLPQSHYLADRNEFQSKIASPLVRAIEKRLNRRISFNVHGKVINFSVRFEPKDIEFHLVVKEF
ncbi:hypothetical protein A2482_04175 [Candidatus Falkowbacteria bacterium RIFOXYC2_FULL_48_21]|uniref:GHMP kinase N-terminal domain-containing protein n=1 Tax=Candidatus Falkowbacteria bacterium RIFOXYC2_FULL_48_21 TaxID=1798005 RepID=A0A1F5TBX0_9BACT|nr:MAG: hypothetical protein A2482_04175 [Candidatus Falkowbacteria bacterium RIFOXYC2_FULL_48_21]